MLNCAIHNANAWEEAHQFSPPSHPGMPPSHHTEDPPAPHTSSQRTDQTSPSPQDNPENSSHTSHSGIAGHDTSCRVSMIKIIKTYGIHKTIFYFFSNLCHF